MPLHSKPSTTTFQPSYLLEFPWVREHSSKTMAFCTWCKKEINIGGMGKTALRSHTKSNKHILNEKTIKKCIPLNVFVKTPVESNPQQHEPRPGPSKQSQPEATVVTPQSAPIYHGDSESTDSQPSQTAPTTRPKSGVKQYLLSESVAKSEIFWCLQIIMNHIPFAVAARCANNFKLQFPDSDIASKLKLDYTKVGYLITFGLAPYFDLQFEKKLKECPHIVLCFDESLNKVSQRQQMDLHIRWWDNATEHVETRYCTSVFLGHSTAEDLLEAIKSAISVQTLNKVVQVSMDGPNVNLKLFNELQKELLNSPDSHSLLNIGSCGLHVIHGAFKAGMKATGWEVVAFLRALYNLFKDSPARRADYIHYSSSNVFPLKFCAIRWVESGRVAERAMTVLPNVKQYVKGVVKDKKEPGCNSFLIVKNNLSDKLLTTKLAFFMSMCSILEPFLRQFQSDAPMAPMIYNDIHSIVLTLMERILKPDYLASVRDKIEKVDLTPENLIPVKQFDLGFAAKDALRASETTSDLEKISLKKSAREAVVCMVKKIMEKSPIKYPLAKSITCLDPSVIKNNQGEKHLSKCLEHLVAKKVMTGIKADVVRRQYVKLFSEDHVINECKSFKRNKIRLDDFFVDLLKAEDEEEYKELKDFIKLILTLSHGNASVERGFSINKECIIDNLREESLVALRKVYDGIQAAGGVEAVEITTSMMQSAKNAHSRYTEYLAKRREEMKAMKTIEEERKRAAKEKKELEAQRLQVLAEASKRAAELDDKIFQLTKKCRKS